MTITIPLDCPPPTEPGEYLMQRGTLSTSFVWVKREGDGLWVVERHQSTKHIEWHGFKNALWSARLEIVTNPAKEKV